MKPLLKSAVIIVTFTAGSRLASELARLNRLDQNRREILRAGGRLEDDFPGEYYGAVVEVVSESSNPIVLASLAGALGTGGMAQRGLAKFGNDAVAPVINVARAKTGLIVDGAPGDTPPHVVADALRTLRLLVEQSTEHVTTQSKLALNREELVAMGVSDSRWADQIQLTARQLLGIR